jgi:hypothetical protein
MRTADHPEKPPSVAVLYARVRRSPDDRPERRALDEGRAWAAAHGVEIAEEVTDRFIGGDSPADREGWSRVRVLVETGKAGMVVTRWHSCIALDDAARRRETAWLTGHGAQLVYTWVPLRDASHETGGPTFA